MSEAQFCLMCLIEMVDIKNMALLAKDKEEIQSLMTYSEKHTIEEEEVRIFNLKQLQSSIRSFKFYIKQKLAQLLQLIDQQIEQIRNEIEIQKLKAQNCYEELQILSKNYLCSFAFRIPNTQLIEKDLELAHFVLESLQSFEQSQNYNQIIQSIELIKSTLPINLSNKSVNSQMRLENDLQHQGKIRQNNFQDKQKSFDIKLLGEETAQLTSSIDDLKQQFNLFINKQMKDQIQLEIIQCQLSIEQVIESKLYMLNQSLQLQIKENGYKIKQQEEQQQLLYQLTTEENKMNVQLTQQLKDVQNQTDVQNRQINKLYASVQQSQKEQHLLEELLKPKISIFLKLQQIPIVKPNLLKNDFWVTLFFSLQERSKKQVKSSYLVYQGSKNGLNHNQFWQCCKDKGNLLMIFKSLNGYIYGGYSPCVWEYHGGKYFQDDTLSSFLFSQKHYQIYHLKSNKKQYAIRCNYSHGPKFGQAHDISIYSCFKDGYSKIGDSYQCTNYEDKQTTHLFGSEKPNITECEIYQILYEEN